MEKAPLFKPWEKAIICLYFLLLGFALGVNIYLIAASRDWGMRLFVFLFFFLPMLFALYAFIKKVKTGKL